MSNLLFLVLNLGIFHIGQKVVYTFLKKKNLTHVQRRRLRRVKAQRRKIFSAISRLNQFNYWHLQHLAGPRIIKIYFYFLFLRLGAFA